MVLQLPNACASEAITTTRGTKRRDTFFNESRKWGRSTCGAPNSMPCLGSSVRREGLRY